MNRRGFTLVELLVVIAITITLMGMVLVAVAVARRFAEQSATKGMIRGLAVATQLYQAAEGQYPPEVWPGWGIASLYCAVTGDADGDGSNAYDAAGIYYVVGKEDVAPFVMGGVTRLAFMDPSGYQIAYDRTWTPAPSGGGIEDFDKQFFADGGTDPRSAAKNVRSFDLFARGVDGKFGTRDDATNW